MRKKKNQSGRNKQSDSEDIETDEENSDSIFPMLYSAGNEAVISQIQQVVMQLQQEQHTAGGGSAGLYSFGGLGLNTDNDVVVTETPLAASLNETTSSPVTDAALHTTVGSVTVNSGESTLGNDDSPVNTQVVTQNLKMQSIDDSVNSVSNIINKILTNQVTLTTATPYYVTDNIAMEGTVYEATLLPESTIEESAVTVLGDVEVTPDGVVEPFSESPVSGEDKKGQDYDKVTMTVNNDTSTGDSKENVEFNSETGNVDMDNDVTHQYTTTEGYTNADDGLSTPSSQQLESDDSVFIGSSAESKPESAQAEITVLDPESVRVHGDLVIKDKTTEEDQISGDTTVVDVVTENPPEIISTKGSLSVGTIDNNADLTTTTTAMMETTVRIQASEEKIPNDEDDGVLKPSTPIPQENSAPVMSEAEENDEGNETDDSIQWLILDGDSAGEEGISEPELALPPDVVVSSNLGFGLSDLNDDESLSRPLSVDSMKEPTSDGEMAIIETETGADGEKITNEMKPLPSVSNIEEPTSDGEMTVIETESEVDGEKITDEIKPLPGVSNIEKPTNDGEMSATEIETQVDSEKITDEMKPLSSVSNIKEPTNDGEMSATEIETEVDGEKITDEVKPLSSLSNIKEPTTDGEIVVTETEADGEKVTGEMKPLSDVSNIKEPTNDGDMVVMEAEKADGEKITDEVKPLPGVSDMKEPTNDGEMALIETASEVDGEKMTDEVKPLPGFDNMKEPTNDGEITVTADEVKPLPVESSFQKPQESSSIQEMENDKEENLPDLLSLPESNDASGIEMEMMNDEIKHTEAMGDDGLRIKTPIESQAVIGIDSNTEIKVNNMAEEVIIQIIPDTEMNKMPESNLNGVSEEDAKKPEMEDIIVSGIEENSASDTDFTSMSETAVNDMSGIDITSVSETEVNNMSETDKNSMPDTDITNISEAEINNVQETEGSSISGTDDAEVDSKPDTIIDEVNNIFNNHNEDTVEDESSSATADVSPTNLETVEDTKSDGNTPAIDAAVEISENVVQDDSWGIIPQVPPIQDVVLAESEAAKPQIPPTQNVVLTVSGETKPLAPAIQTVVLLESGETKPQAPIQGSVLIESGDTRPQVLLIPDATLSISTNEGDGDHVDITINAVPVPAIEADTEDETVNEVNSDPEETIILPELPPPDDEEIDILPDLPFPSDEEQCGGSFLKVQQNVICGSLLRNEPFEDEGYEDGTYWIRKKSSFSNYSIQSIA